jgi:hypothetical protein
MDHVRLGSAAAHQAANPEAAAPENFRVKRFISWLFLISRLPHGQPNEEM